MTPPYPLESYRKKLLPLRQQLSVRNDWLRQRLDTVLPHIMAREEFDMWIIIAREYNEDPVVMTMLREPEMAARRRTILVFTRRPDGSVERLTVSRYGQSGFYESCWDPAAEEQYACLARIVRERDPARIGINHSAEFAFGDGLTYTEYQLLAGALGVDYMGRAHGAERLALGWLERRIPDEMAAYPAIVALGHAIIAEAFSSRVIHPGITTTEDVVWWMRQTMHDMGLRAWFQPAIEIQARGEPYPTINSAAPRRTRILPGDLLWCDMGFSYLGLTTDQQQHAYVLRPGESDAPAGLRAALADGNRLQSIHLEEMIVGRTGNEVLAATLDRARAEGLAPMVYSHPLGYHGHAAGPTIGLWDQQGGVPGRGDYPLFDETCYSIELNVRKDVPEWDGQPVRIALEEDAALDGGVARWLDGRQMTFHLID